MQLLRKKNNLGEEKKEMKKIEIVERNERIKHVKFQH